MDDALYFPIHRAKKGELTAAAHLSPYARCRVRPVFEIQVPDAAASLSLEEYLAEQAAALCDAWGTSHPVFLDLPHFGPDVKARDGSHCITFLFECLRQHRMLAIPTTGTVSVRGPGTSYLNAVATIASNDKRGAGLRLTFYEFYDQRRLVDSFDSSLSILGVDSIDVDLFLDFESLAILPHEYQTASGIAALLTELRPTLRRSGFRNVVVCGSTIPESVGKEYNDAFMHVDRTDFLAWEKYVRTILDASMRFGDYGVIYPLEQDVTGKVNPPARIRISTPKAHFLWRADRGGYADLAKSVTKSPEFALQRESWGATAVRQSAEYGRDSGGPTEWVARDTNLHVETTTRAVELLLDDLKLLDRLEFAEENVAPWDQTLIS